ncbi:MAG: VWA domain-containing protein [Alphaproteobacteria bacterium]|nr:VWA domain-containing protein [Alphaproteobacteria bacterium]MCB9694597.1 VWA domain-containing protein [Alphaproteobacteria bacterium]
MSDGRRQLVYWRTLMAALGDDEANAGVERVMGELVDDLDLPRLTLDPRASVDQIVKRKPSLEPLLALPDTDDDWGDEGLMRTVLYLKSVLNVFGQVGGESVTAEEYARWLDDVRAFERASGYRPGTLMRGQGSGGGQATTEGDVEEALREIGRGAGLMSEPEIQAGLKGIEKRLIDRMQLREVLADAKLAAKLTPSMALTAQLLRDKDHLDGPALRNAKALIKRFVDELGDVLLKQVMSADTGPIDRSIPPKRVFRNLDLKRTIWANLTNWDPKGERLYVDRLYYHHKAKKQNKTRLVVVVDQSGSMVPAMVNCTILASIFAGLPRIEAHLIAYDTTALDLSPWVHDPFEVLLRTQLGGGTDGTCAMPLVLGHITDPKNTVIAWISDFYDNRELMPMFTALVRSGVTFIPVGSVASSGYFSVDAWFRKELQALGTPVLSGSLKTLIKELKAALP